MVYKIGNEMESAVFLLFWEANIFLVYSYNTDYLTIYYILLWFINHSTMIQNWEKDFCNNGRTEDFAGKIELNNPNSCW